MKPMIVGPIDYPMATRWDGQDGVEGEWMILAARMTARGIKLNGRDFKDNRWAVDILTGNRRSNLHLNPAGMYLAGTFSGRTFRPTIQQRWAASQLGINQNIQVKRMAGSGSPIGATRYNPGAPLSSVFPPPSLSSSSDVEDDIEELSGSGWFKGWQIALGAFCASVMWGVVLWMW